MRNTTTPITTKATTAAAAIAIINFMVESLVCESFLPCWGVFASPWL